MPYRHIVATEAHAARIHALNHATFAGEIPQHDGCPDRRARRGGAGGLLRRARGVRAAVSGRYRMSNSGTSPGSARTKPTPSR